jgi:hypothetical protein
MNNDDDKRLIRAYRRIKNKCGSTMVSDRAYLETNLDNDSIDSRLDGMIAELEKGLKSKISNTRFRSNCYGRVDGLIKFSIIFITSLVGLFGVFSAINIEQGKIENYYTISLYAGLLSLFVTLMSSLRDSFKLRDRSLVLRNAYYDLNRSLRDLRRLQISGKEPIDILDELDSIEYKIDIIDSKMFEYKLMEMPGMERELEESDYLNPRERDMGPPPLEGV